MSTSHGWARGLSCSTSTANQQLACTTLMFKHEYRVHQGIVDMRLETSEIRYSEIRNLERICAIHLTFIPKLKHFPDILANKQALKLLDWKFKRNGLKRVFFIHEPQV